MRLISATAVAAAALFAAGCTAGTAHTGASLAPLPPDPHTAAALLKIATTFNHDYDTGDYGPVYTRWDARSQAIITRACPVDHGTGSRSQMRIDAMSMVPWYMNSRLS
jgi:hypothetical protein